GRQRNYGALRQQCPTTRTIRHSTFFAFLPNFGGMKSMTGYGRGDCSQDGFKITVELSSVNRKQSEISINLPREMEMLEAQMRDAINKHIARGRLTARVTLHSGGNSAARMHLNVPLAKAYTREL